MDSPATPSSAGLWWGIKAEPTSSSQVSLLTGAFGFTSALCPLPSTVAQVPRIMVLKAAGLGPGTAVLLVYRVQLLSISCWQPSVYTEWPRFIERFEGGKRANYTNVAEMGMEAFPSKVFPAFTHLKTISWSPYFLPGTEQTQASVCVGAMRKNKHEAGEGRCSGSVCYVQEEGGT